MTPESTFGQLVERIQAAHRELAAQAGRAINISLTLRNWLIGCYIAEYELNGQDRAQYGDRLFSDLAGALKALSNCNRRQLYRYRRFYSLYPQIVGSLPPQLRDLPMLTGAQMVVTASPPSPAMTLDLVTRLSYSHFDELVDITDATKRSFYEVECIRGNWSVRELKRQIGSLYFERSGLSLDKKKLAAMAQQGAEIQTILPIRDPYVFEFLGLKPAEVMSESDLEAQLTEKLQAFLLELGHGFCFEARQKRILIGDELFFVDLVFYHRILKCHVLVELKLENFRHENLGQLNTYVNWYRRHMMTEGDNPPVGILLCTDKNHALAEYALAGMDNHLFVSKYLLELPQKEEMQRFIDEQLREAGE
ncbi:MAG: PDDEXK nuclease domain-containing protein [Halieaceae bacterium]|jgi:predicted nuclease of restriction endonuclease-like (RecB) superfamily|nr:PDDEXK nuclease domain-containing protein [Halieaceae bacterium]